MITIVAFGFLHLFVSHVGVLGLAIFYGSLSAAYFARESAIMPATLGGIAGSLLAGFVLVVDRWEKAAGPYTAAKLGLHEPSLGITLLAMVPIALVALLPISLAGAVAGDLLAERRRSR